MGRLRSFLRLARIDHGVMVVVAVLTGVLAAGGVEFLFSENALLAYLSALLAEVGVFVFNDVFNIEEDRVNAPDRPLVKGEVTVKEACIFGACSLALALLLAYSVNFWVFTLAVLGISVSMLYNKYVKRIGPLGNAVVAVSTALPFVYGSASAASSIWEVPLCSWVFFGIAALATYSREIVKGIKDVEGDSRVGVRTYAVLWGEERAAKLALIFMVAAVLLSFPAYLYVRNRFLYAVFVTPTDFVLMYSSLIIALNPSREMAEKSRKLSLLGMALGILAFLGGSV